MVYSGDEADNSSQGMRLIRSSEDLSPEWRANVPLRSGDNQVSLFFLESAGTPVENAGITFTAFDCNMPLADVDATTCQPATFDESDAYRCPSGC